MRADLDDPWDVVDIRAHYARPYLVNGTVSLLLGLFLLNYCSLSGPGSCPGVELTVTGGVFSAGGLLGLGLGALRRRQAFRGY